MTLRIFLHLKSKRAKTVALLDLGATENFMSLDYAKYLHLPIKALRELRKLFNIDRTPNQAGDLKYFHRSHHQDRNKINHAQVLPLRLRRQQSHPRVPLVRSCPTQD
jgi:hypothetical protein